MHVEEVDGIELVERNVRRLLPGEKQGEAAKAISVPTVKMSELMRSQAMHQPCNAPTRAASRAVRQIAGMMPIAASLIERCPRARHRADGEIHLAGDHGEPDARAMIR